MWEIPDNNAVWDCFKTLTLSEILKTQNRPRETTVISALLGILGRRRKEFKKKQEEERIVAKSRPTMNLVSQTAASSSTAPSSSTSSSPVILKASSQSLILTACTSGVGLAAEDSNQNDATSSSQAWQSDVKPNPRARRPASHGNRPRLGSFSTRAETCGQRFRHRRRRLRMAKQLSRYLPRPSHILRRSTQTCG